MRDRPVSAYSNTHAQDEICSERHPNAFVLDNKMTDFHVSEYSRNVVKWVTGNGKPPKLSAKDWLWQE